MISLAAIAVAAIAVSAYEWRAAHRVVDSPTIEFPIKLADRSTTQTLLQSFAISPDGKVVAFIARGANGQHQVFTRALNDSRPRPLIGTDGAFSVFFSPDGKWIGFGAGGRIRKVSIEGGSVLPVGTIQGIYGGATWAPGGEIVVSMSSGGLYALKESGGGAPRKVCKTGLAKTSLIEALPVATPDPDRVLFTNFETQSPAGAKIAIASLSSGECKVFDFAGVNALGMIDGLLLYTTAEGVVMAVPFNDRRHESTGSPVPVLTDFEVNQTTGAASASMSRNGSLVFASGLTPVEVQLVDIHGQSQPLLGEQLSYAYPRFSPDGRKIAITIGTPGQRDVWVYDLQSKTSVRISSEGDGEVNERPEWTPDGRSVLYRSSRGKRAGLWWRRVDLSEREKPLLVNDREDYWEVVMTPDGKGIVYQLDTAGADILYRQLNGDTVPKPIAATTAIESMGRVSPDGRWIAYVTPESGTDQVVVQAFPQSAGQIQVSIGSGREPVWSHDGTRLYYRDDRHIVEARFTTAPSFAVTSRQTLFDDTFLRAPFHANYDVTPDGTHFMFLKATDDAELITVYNWIADVRRKLRERASN
jgi:serine/threonine-protein kinase